MLQADHEFVGFAEIVSSGHAGYGYDNLSGRSIAVPQGLRRGTVAAGLAVLFAYLVDNNEPWGYALVAGMLTLWAIYGVYRTVVQARAPKEYTDLV